MSTNRLLSILTCCFGSALAGSAHASMISAAQYSGNYNIQVHAFGQACGNGASSTFNSVNIVPGGATVVDAFLLSGDFAGFGAGGGAMAASLGGQSLGTVQPFTQDPGLFPTSFAYYWNATSVITNSGNYSVSIAPGLGQIPAFQMCGAALVVVTQHASYPARTISLNLGTLTVGDNSANEMVSSSFNELIPNSIGAGQGQLMLFTLADDAFNMGEQLAFNGQIVPAPGAFDGNLGVNASLVVQPVTVQAGTNTTDITTNGDYFAWHMAMLISPVPEPSALTTILLTIVLMRRGRHRVNCADE
jgi:hypothetical protein